MNFHIVFYDSNKNEIARATKQIPSIGGYLPFDAEDIPAGAAGYALEIGDKPRMTEDEFKEKYGITLDQLKEAQKDASLVDVKAEEAEAVVEADATVEEAKG